MGYPQAGSMRRSMIQDIPWEDHLRDGDRPRALDPRQVIRRKVDDGTHGRCGPPSMARLEGCSQRAHVIVASPSGSHHPVAAMSDRMKKAWGRSV